jgi:hypothetical protein
MKLRLLSILLLLPEKFLLKPIDITQNSGNDSRYPLTEEINMEKIIKNIEQKKILDILTNQKISELDKLNTIKYAEILGLLDLFKNNLYDDW